MPVNPSEHDTFECRPDRLHRYGYIVVAPIALVTAIAALVQRQPMIEVVISFIGAVAFAVYGWERLKQRLVVARDGLVKHGLWERTVTFDQVASYRLRDTSDPWEPTDLADFLIWPFVLLVRYLVYRPVRAVIRWILVRREDRSFLDGELVLLDGAGKKLIAIAGSDRYDNIAGALERITAAIHARPLPPFALTGKKGPIALDTIAELDVGARETTVSTAAGRVAVPTDEIPNLYLVIDAVRTRGGRVTVDSDVFVPRRQLAELA